jgi:hypothetical protein
LPDYCGIFAAKFNILPAAAFSIYKAIPGPLFPS